MIVLFLLTFVHLRVFAFGIVNFETNFLNGDRKVIINAVGRRRRSRDEWLAGRRSRPTRIVDGERIRSTESDRNLELFEEEEAVSVGTGLGTHFAYVWVGTPPQRQSVILDTGSYHTGFTCDPCTSCGDYLSYHECGPFEPLESSTYVQQGSQTWQASYSEGDGWKAHVAIDKVSPTLKSILCECKLKPPPCSCS